MGKQETEGRSPEAGFRLFKDHETDWVFARTLQYMYEKAAEIGDCLYVARRIDEADGESWIKEWVQLAAKVEARARISLSKGHIISGREAYLCAANYYRTAEYGTPPSHSRFHELWEKSVRCFQAASQLFDPPIQTINVPFKGYKLPGYFWRPDSSTTTRPTLIAAGGNDTSLEEVFFLCGPATVRRGYNFVTFNHPGHRGAVHLYSDCIRRHDYEVPYRTAIDYLITLPGVDERIALTGFSYGGYVATRVATYEDRLKAVIPNSPIIDVTQEKRSYGRESLTRKILLKLPESFFNRLVERMLKKSPLKYALAKYILWVFGIHDMTWSEAMKQDMYKLHTIRDSLHEITCPALALVSDCEGKELLRQAKEFYEGISSKIKKLYIFNLEKDGSNDHIQLDNRLRGNQVMFDWLDEVLEYRFKPEYTTPILNRGAPDIFSVKSRVQTSS